MPTGGEMRRLGPIGVVRLAARGVPLFSGGREEEWQQVTTPAFPLTFVLISALSAAIVEVVGAGYYSFRYPTVFPNFLWDELEATFLAVGIVQSVIVLWQYVVTAYLLRFVGLSEKDARGNSARITYFSAMYQVVFVPAWVGWEPNPMMRAWSPSFGNVLLGIVLLFVLFRVAAVVQGVRRCEMGSLGLGLISAALCPELSLPVIFLLFGPLSVIPTLLLFFAVPLVLEWRLRRKYPEGHCQSCGYNLTGNVSGRCPECGTEIDGEDAMAHERG